MKREILFKAKRSDGKGWVQGDLVTDGKYSKNNLFWIFPDDADEYDFNLSLKVIPETVCQYTGLKDKNGEKIFEGDELFINRIGDFPVEQQQFVVYTDYWGAFGTNLDNVFDWLRYEGKIVIIGNIHDEK